MTTTLYNLVHTDLIKKGYNEFENEKGELVLFDKEHQFIQKMIRYDNEVAEVMNELFYHLQLDDLTYDTHFKKTFLLRFMNRRINKQTRESFQTSVMSTFLTHQTLISEAYQNIEKYLTGTTESIQENKQLTDGTTTSDNRQAYADLPQNQVNLDVDDTVMTSASDNTISRNKQANQQQTDGTATNTAKTYQLDALIQASGTFEQIFILFDKTCFMQVW